MLYNYSSSVLDNDRKPMFCNFSFHYSDCLIHIDMLSCCMWCNEHQVNEYTFPEFSTRSWRAFWGLRTLPFLWWYGLVCLSLHSGPRIVPFTRCLKITEKVSFNILRLHFEWTKVNQKWSILASFWKPKACGQTVLPDRSVLIGQKLMENAKCDILSNFQTM